MTPASFRPAPCARRVASVALAVALAIAPDVSRAESPAPRFDAPLAESLQGPARSAYSSAKILLNNNDPQGALTMYKQAYQLSKDPRLLFDMAICERGLRAYGRMQSLLEQYKREMGARISADDAAAVNAALLAIRNLVGSLTVTTAEAGATVTLDGEARGTTPLSAPLVVDPGKHLLVVSKAGFEDVERTVEVVGGAGISVTLPLIRENHEAHLLVVSDSEASVVIDGKVEAVGRFDGRLPPGPHVIKVTETGKRPYEADVDLVDSETRTLQVALEPEHKRLLWPYLVGGGVVLAAGAAVGAYFLFKPTDSVTPIPSGSFGQASFASSPRKH